MRITRFETFMHDLLARSGSSAIKDVRTFAEAGHTDKPAGIEVTFQTTASVLLQFVRTSPPGGDSNSQPVVEGDVLPPSDLPAFDPADGKISVKNFETFLAALVETSGSTEIKAVRTFTGRSHKFGIQVDFYSGASGYMYFLQTLRPGQAAGAHPDFNAKEFI